MLILLCLLGTACVNEEDTKHYTVPKEKEATRALTSEMFSWTKPNDWSFRIPQSAMQLSTFVAPAIYDDHIENPNTSATITLTYIEGESGDLNENISRWANQLNMDKVNKQKVVNEYSAKNLHFYIVTLFSQEENGDSILAAITRNNTGTLFVKMRGPLSTIKWQGDNFINFLDSLKNKD